MAHLKLFLSLFPKANRGIHYHVHKKCEDIPATAYIINEFIILSVDKPL